jgi:uncharacterized protein (TIGR02996 family)|nr:TIGR02996 domain-containing protein [Kofleriaceae bacterium]
MTSTRALLDAIRAAPGDPGPQLVIADLLLEQGDPRGELIILDHGERAGRLTEPAAVERLLLLAAEYTFPCASEPDESLLPSTGPAGYHNSPCILHWNGLRYGIRYRPGSLLCMTGDGTVTRVDECPTFTATSGWTDAETFATLAVFSDAIRHGTPLGPMRFPHHPSPPPVYDGGARRVYRLPERFMIPRGLARDRYGLAARDYRRWNALCDRL